MNLASRREKKNKLFAEKREILSLNVTNRSQRFCILLLNIVKSNHYGLWTICDPSLYQILKRTCSNARDKNKIWSIFDIIKCTYIFAVKRHSVQLTIFVFVSDCFFGCCCWICASDAIQITWKLLFVRRSNVCCVGSCL